MEMWNSNNLWLLYKYRNRLNFLSTHFQSNTIQNIFHVSVRIDAASFFFKNKWTSKLYSYITIAIFDSETSDKGWRQFKQKIENSRESLEKQKYWCDDGVGESHHGRTSKTAENLWSADDGNLPTPSSFGVCCKQVSRSGFQLFHL